MDRSGCSERAGRLRIRMSRLNIGKGGRDIMMRMGSGGKMRGNGNLLYLLNTDFYLWNEFD